MARLLRFALSAVLAINASAAHASFIIETAPSATGPESSDLTPSDNPAPPAAADSEQPIHWLMAYGFGNKVPLAFACRQIVPAAVKVTYGPGVNPATPVTWKGGDTWNHVLRDTVTPLGLHLQMTYMAVEIEKNAPE
jgi:hypothetical protein